MTIDKKLLKRLTILYVEDEEKIRIELYDILKSFFKNIFVAKDGEEGLNIFVKEKNNIDLIISDINMPKLTGIEMMKKIRGFDKEIPVIFLTAYSDNDFLAEAIKIKVYDYIVKPIDIRKLLTTINELALVLYQNYLIDRKNIELENYLKVIENNNIVIKLSLDRKIVYINDKFKEIIKLDNIINKDFIELAYDENSKANFIKMFEELEQNEQYSTQLKLSSTDKEPRIIEANSMLMHNRNDEVIGIIIIANDITDKIMQQKQLQKQLIKDKTKILQEAKNISANAQRKISQLEQKILELEKSLKKAIEEKDKIINQTEVIRLDYKRMQVDLASCQKNLEQLSLKGSSALKINRELVDAKQEIKKLQEENKRLKEDIEKGFKTQRAEYEVKIDDLEAELEKYKALVDDIGDIDAVTHKIEYWKKKYQEVQDRVEDLESKIMKYADKETLKKIFE